MTDLPNGWAWSTLGEVAEVVAGPAFSSKKFVDPEDGVALLRGDNIEPGKLRWRGARAWPSEKLDGLDHLYVNEGDVILAMDRPVVSGGLKLARVTSSDLPALLVQRVARIRTGSGLLPGYVYALLQQGSFVAHLLRGQTGTQIPHVTLASIEQYSIPLPPLPEQRRIVAAIEEHFSRLDAAEADLQAAVVRTFALVDAGYQAILCQPGNLVRLASVCDTSSGGTPSRRRPDFYEGSIPWIKSGELQDEMVGETEERISDEAVGASSAKMVPGNTILMAMYGATIGKMGRTPEGGATTNQAIAAFFPKQELSDEYLWAVLRAKRRELKRAGKGGAQPNISQTVLRDLVFPLPERAEQLSAASAARKVDETASMIRGDLKVALRRSKSLRRSVLTAAFSGQLVAQDTADEPASVLLERIAAERAAAKRTRRKKGAT